KEIIVIGAGGHAAEGDEYLRLTHVKRESEDYTVLGFIEDNPDSYNQYLFGAPYLGTIKEHQIDRDKHYIIAIANIAYRKPIVNRFVLEGARFMTFIHSAAYVSPTAKIGRGVIIAPFVNIGPNVA